MWTVVPHREYGNIKAKIDSGIFFLMYKNLKILEEHLKKKINKNKISLISVYPSLAFQSVPL